MYYDGDYPDEWLYEADMMLDMDGLEDIVEPEPGIREIYENCLVPSAYQFYAYVEILIVYTLVFRLAVQVVQRVGRGKLDFLSHLVSIGCGNMILLRLIGSSTLYCLAFVYLMYVCLVVVARWQQLHSHRQDPTSSMLGYSMGALCLAILTGCEIFDWNPSVWRQIRGVLMIAAMKVLSLAFDESAGRPTNVLAYLGYMFCPANCIIGPWSSYGDYTRVVRHGSKLLTLKVILWTCMNLVFVFLFAMSSNCLVPAMIANDSWRWLLAYRDALSFRCSHYFIAFLSQLTMVIGGFATEDHNVAPLHSNLVGYRVVRPLSMELPRSLTQVVTDWNIPTHNWLKLYVFRPLRRRSITLAILFTYFVSAMLHGMNFQLAAVLLSLGIFSLIEHNLRSTIADYLDACVRAKACRTDACNHRLKNTAPVCLLINGLFSGFAVVHLAFLGMIFNITTSNDDDRAGGGVGGGGGFLAEDEFPGGSDDDTMTYRLTLNKWSQLNWASYWICLGCLLCDILLRI